MTQLRQKSQVATSGMRFFSQIVHCVLFVLISVSLCQANAPNVIIILADDLGYADLACYGNRFNETPRIDSLANRGMRFTQFYAGPVCSPTRANLQSGLDQARFGITQHIPGHRRPFAKLSDPIVPLQLPIETLTFAEHLQESGYTTGYFGKWHLGGEGFGPGAQGWQVFEETRGNTMQGKAKDPSAQRTAKYLTDRATEFIAANKAKPFLLQVSHHAVHIPLSTTDELLAKYRAKSPAPGYPSNPEYAGLLEELDQSVGAIVDAVEQHGLSNQTMVVFLSDNGGLEHEQGGDKVTSNTPLRGEKGTLYEGGIRIPSIWCWPTRIKSGTTCDTPAITIDIFATLSDLSKSADKTFQTDGVSLVPLLDDPKASLDREAFYWHLPHYHHSTPASAIRKGDWKLIEFYENQSIELYNLRSEVGEKVNLASKEATVAEDLQASLRAWRLRVNARMPILNPDYDPVRSTELGKGKDRKERKK